MKEKIIYGILAGVFIAMAAVAFLSAANAVVGSVLFAFGLLTIVNYNFQLFTGAVGYISVQQKRNDYFSYSLFCVGVWFWNLVGAIITGTLIAQTKTYGKILPKLEALMQSKCNDSNASLLVLGIFCGRFSCGKNERGFAAAKRRQLRPSQPSGSPDGKAVRVCVSKLKKGLEEERELAHS